MQTDSWTQEEMLNEFGGCETLGELIAGLEDKYSESDQLVCEIRVNGMLLEDDDEVRFAATSIKEITDLSVSVGRLSELLNDVHHAFLECIPSLHETAVRASDFFRAGDLSSAQNVFSALLEGCQWLIDTLVQTRRAGVRTAEPLFSGGEWAAISSG